MRTTDAVQHYINNCLEQGVKASTIVNKQSILNRFAQRFPEVPTDPDHIFKFLATVGHTQSTRKGARKHIRAFYTFVCGLIDIPDPMPRVAVPLRAAKRSGAYAPVLHGGGGRTDVLNRTPPTRPSPAPTVDALSTSEAITIFLASKKSRWSDNTFDWYNDTFTPFAARFKLLPLEPEPLEEFIAEPESEHKRWVRFRTLRTLYIFLHKRRDLPNPFDKIDPLSPKEAPVLPLDDDETNRLLDLDLSPQDAALVHALLTTGMRPGELLNLKPADIKEDTLVLDGKTGVDRVPVKPEVRDLLLQTAGTNHVFEDEDGKPPSRWTLYRMIENIMLRANVREGKGGARVFRHTFVTRVQEETGDLHFAQRLARHAKITTTTRYTHIGMKDTVKKYQELDVLRHRQQPEASTGGASPDGALDHVVPPEEPPFPVEGAAQIPLIIPGDDVEPTPPYIIREYAYTATDLEDPRRTAYPLRGWRILGSNGAWWPANSSPKDFLSFEEAQQKIRELWKGEEA